MKYQRRKLENGVMKSIEMAKINGVAKAMA